MDVSVERWPSAAQQGRQHSLQEARALLQQAASGKPPLHGGRREPLPSAPRTPAKSERPQSPTEDAPGEAAAEAELRAAGAGHAAAAAAAAGRHVIAEHRAAAAAELVASLTGNSLSSPFAAVAARPLSPGSEEPAGGSPGMSAAATRGSTRAAALSGPAPSAPAGHASGAFVSAAEQRALTRRLSSGPPQLQLHGSSREASAVGGQPRSGSGVSAAAGTGGGARRHLRLEHSDSEELPSPPLAPLQQPAVPEAAVEQYCLSLGTRMFWVSARTGGQSGSQVQLAGWLLFRGTAAGVRAAARLAARAQAPGSSLTPAAPAMAWQCGSKHAPPADLPRLLPAAPGNQPLQARACWVL